MIRSLILSLSLLIPVAHAMENDSLNPESIDWSSATIHFPQYKVRGLAENQQLKYDAQGFFVRTQEDNDVRVENGDIAPFLRGRTVEEIAKYGTLSKFKVTQFNNGEYSVSEDDSLNGGGVGGATAGAWVGYVGVTTACHGLIHAIGWCFGPAGGSVAFGLSKALAGPIHALAVGVGVGTGVVGAVATGPV